MVMQPFEKPVFVGDLVSCYTRITRVGNTSLTVDVEVFAERGWVSGEFGLTVKVTEAELIFVAIDEQRRPTMVPPEDEQTIVV